MVYPNGVMAFSTCRLSPFMKNREAFILTRLLVTAVTIIRKEKKFDHPRLKQPVIPSQIQRVKRSLGEVGVSEER